MLRMHFVALVALELILIGVTCYLHNFFVIQDSTWKYYRSFFPIRYEIPDKKLFVTSLDH